MKNSPQEISSVSLFLSVDAQTWVMNRIFDSKSGFVESPHPYLPNQKSFWKVVAPKVCEKIYFHKVAKYYKKILYRDKNLYREVNFGCA